MSVARNRRGRKTAEQIARDMLPPIESTQAAPLTPTPERKAAFDEKWQRRISRPAPTEYQDEAGGYGFMKVDRIEVIDAGGRAFSARYEAGAYIDVQDDGRTMKIFVGESRG